MPARDPSVGLGPESQVGGGLRGQAQVGKVGFSPAPPLPRLASLPVPIQPSSSAALGRAAANCREGQARGCPPHPGGIPVTCQRCRALLQVALTCQHRVHCALHPEQVGIPGTLQHHGKIMPGLVHQGQTKGEWSKEPKNTRRVPGTNQKPF